MGWVFQTRRKILRNVDPNQNLIKKWGPFQKGKESSLPNIIFEGQHVSLVEE